MSPAALFAMGVLVTLFYGTGLSLLVYGAILDGRDEARRKAEEAESAEAAERAGRTGVGRRPSAVPDDTSTEAGDVPAAA
jgi:hypothetical protein